MAATREPVWQEINDAERSELWDRFEAAFAFKPSSKAPGPAISEPPGAVTFDLTPVADTWAVHALNALVIRSFVQVLAEGDCLIVLDWQHPAYRFWPQRTTLYDAGGPFPCEVFPYPDGDYYGFFTEDLSEGTLGHPWEPSLCVFGSRLVPLLRPLLSQLAPVLREF